MDKPENDNEAQETGAIHAPETLDAETGKPVTDDGKLDDGKLSFGKDRKIKLATLGNVRHEMSAVYKQAARGKLDTLAGYRLVQILRAIAEVLTVEQLEGRIARLESGLQGALPAPIDNDDDEGGDVPPSVMARLRERERLANGN